MLSFNDLQFIKLKSHKYEKKLKIRNMLNLDFNTILVNPPNCRKIPIKENIIIRKLVIFKIHRYF